MPPSRRTDEQSGRQAARSVAARDGRVAKGRRLPYLAETLRRAGVIRNLWFSPACESLDRHEVWTVCRS